MDLELITKTILDALPHDRGTIALHEPMFVGNEWRYVKECLDTAWVSSAGPFVRQFEAALAQYTGAHHAIAVVNGTAALHTCLMLAGVQTHDEVLLPSLTFVATANAVAYCRATAHFVDVDTTTLGVDHIKLDTYLATITEMRDGLCHNRLTGRPIRALIVMHTCGHPCDLDALAEVCNRFQLELIEDAAESLGSFYKGAHTGTVARLAALSFNGNKIITTGGGGAILTSDTTLAERARHLTTTAKLPHAWEYVHDEVGYNYRMPNLNAALGVAQLENMDMFLAKKRLLAARLQTAFNSNNDGHLFIEPPFARSNYWLNLLMLKQTEYRDDVISALHTKGVQVRPFWTLMHTLAMYRACPRMDLSTSEHLQRCTVCLPGGAGLAP